jgi:hypothetical protein
MTTTMSEDLERMVDGATLRTVLRALEGICQEKSEFIRANWQDETLAMAWRHAARRLNATVEVIGKLGI